MRDFLELYNRHQLRLGFRLEICHSSIMDYTLIIGYKSTHINASEHPIISIQSNDYNLLFVNAYVQLVEWLLENEGGY